MRPALLAEVSSPPLLAALPATAAPPMRTSTPYGTALCRLRLSVKSTARSRLRAAAQPAAADAGSGTHAGRLRHAGWFGWRVRTSRERGRSVRRLRCSRSDLCSRAFLASYSHAYIFQKTSKLDARFHLTLSQKEQRKWFTPITVRTHSVTHRQTHEQILYDPHCTQRSIARKACLSHESHTS